MTDQSEKGRKPSSLPIAIVLLSLYVGSFIVIVLVEVETSISHALPAAGPMRGQTLLHPLTEMLSSAEIKPNTEPLRLHIDKRDLKILKVSMAKYDKH